MNPRRESELPPREIKSTADQVHSQAFLADCIDLLYGLPPNTKSLLAPDRDSAHRSLASSLNAEIAKVLEPLEIGDSVAYSDASNENKPNPTNKPAENDALKRHHVRHLVTLLDHPKHETRLGAYKKLEGLGPAVLPLLTDIRDQGTEGGRLLARLIEPHMKSLTTSSLLEWTNDPTGWAGPCRQIEQIPSLINQLLEITEERLKERKNSLSTLISILSNPSLNFGGELPWASRRHYLENFRIQLGELSDLDKLKDRVKQVTKIHILPGGKHVDSKLECLKGLPNLQSLDLSDTDLTDAGLAHLKGMTSLQFLNLSQTNLGNSGLAHLKELTNLTSLYMGNTGISDSGLAHLAKMTKLGGLMLSDNKLNGDGLVHLKGMTDLELLHLDNTGLSDTGLMHIKGLTKLTGLRLANTNITDRGLTYLKELTDLETLAICGPSVSITDAGLVNTNLKGKTKLRFLYLNDTGVTDDGLSNITRCTNLEWLELQNTKISDAGLAHFKKLSNLETLQLQNTQISKAGLFHLKGLTNLRYLDLRGTRVKKADLADLKKALPTCAIKLDDPAL